MIRLWNYLTPQEQEEVIRAYFNNGDDFHEYYEDIVQAMIERRSFCTTEDIATWWNELDEDSQDAFLPLPYPD